MSMLGDAAARAARAAGKKAAGASTARATEIASAKAAKTAAARATAKAAQSASPRTPSLPRTRPAGGMRRPEMPAAAPGRAEPAPPVRKHVAKEARSAGQELVRNPSRTGAGGVKANVKDAVASAASGAVSGAIGGAAAGGVGALPGAAIGAAKGLVTSRGFRPVIAAAIIVPMVLGLSVSFSLAGLVSTGVAATEAGTQKAAEGAAAAAGTDEDDISRAHSITEGSRVPWQVALAYQRETDTDLDVAALEAALATTDPAGNYRHLDAGAVYGSSGLVRTIGESGKSISEITEKTWVAAMTAITADESTAGDIIRTARAWMLGQTFSCSTEIGGAGDSDVDLDGEQLANATTIIGVAKSALKTDSKARQAAIIALATAMQESSLRNIDYGDRDSVGLFQQRPSAGWGTVEQIMNPAYSAGKFFKALVKIPGWDTMAVTEAAQKVQISAFPDAYAKWEAMARATVASKFIDAPKVDIPAEVGYTAPEGEGPDDKPSGSALCIGAGLIVNGTVGPPVVHYVISGGFGPRSAPVPGASTWHKGVDLALYGCENTPPKREPIYAAAGGTVTRAGLWGGYGYAVEIDHGNGFSTRYGHMMSDSLRVSTGDTVAVGQQIGDMGTTGMSSGCHLHFETLINGKQENPLIVMLRLGVKI